MRSTRLVRSCLAAMAVLCGLAVDPIAAASPSHRIFLTSIAYDGDLNGLAGADALCQAHGTTGQLTASLGYQWRALLSVDGVVDAKNRFVWSGPVADVTGLVVTNDPGTWPWADNGDSTIDVDEDGNAPPDSFAWSGSLITGVSKGAGFDCVGWTSNAGTDDGWAGQNGNFPSEDWFDSFGSGCGDEWYSIICVSDAKIFADGFEVVGTCNWSDNPGSGEVCP